ncbi:MAG: triose-phosphate isomerase [Chitinophagales bacterium]|nr:triose-phosphate isomerase [Chitinophagales bacterium]
MQEFAEERIGIGAQNVSRFNNGAYTGEISANMLQSLGVEFVIVGHSERRHYFKETDEIINLKIKQALQYNIVPIICCGETLEIRENGSYLTHIEVQLTQALQDISANDIQNCMIAYEPVWAIGTGKTATPSQAAEVHTHIRKVLQKLYDETVAANTTILYGGSVKASNAKELFSEDEIDGALVGGASLNAIEFTQIIKSL